VVPSALIVIRVLWSRWWPHVEKALVCFLLLLADKGRAICLGKVTFFLVPGSGTHRGCSCQVGLTEVVVSAVSENSNTLLKARNGYIKCLTSQVTQNCCFLTAYSICGEQLVVVDDA